MKNTIKKFIPEFIILFYHWLLARLAALVYSYPSNKLIVIGVTGTNGKSTVVNLIAKVLEGAGYKIGLASTYNFKDGEKEWLNNKKMTMLGRFQLQNFLSRLVRNGCQYAVIETSSEGIRQYRHVGINYDIAVFTNLTPEHIETHGSFENYKKAKGKLFSSLKKSKNKKINKQLIKKIIITNLEDEHSDFFLSFPADEKYGFSLTSIETNINKVIASQVRTDENGSYFIYGGKNFNINLLGDFNVSNCLAALAVGLSQGINIEQIKSALEKVEKLPGRLEFINKGQNFKVLIDYAPEVASMKKLYGVVNLLKKNKIIHVLGSCGGGRDESRRSVLGGIAGKSADIVVVTNEDPYDEDPQAIIDQVAEGAEEEGKLVNKDLFKIIDRREAIKLALGKAGKDDLVIITGKGAEQAICMERGRKVPWDDRKVVEEILANFR